MKKGRIFDDDCDPKVGWLNGMHNACKGIRNCTFHMEHLAAAFNTTGNMTMGEEIYALVDCLNRHQEVVYRGIGEKVSEQLRDSEQQTANVLGLVLNAAMAKQ